MRYVNFIKLLFCRNNNLSTDEEVPRGDVDLMNQPPINSVKLKSVDDLFPSSIQDYEDFSYKSRLSGYSVENMIGTIDSGLEGKEVEVLHKSSLLDNTAYMKLAEGCSILIEEIDRYYDMMQSDESKKLISLVKTRIKENLVMSGASRITGDTNFVLLKHIPVPPQETVEDQIIDCTLEDGIAIEDRVLIRAKVKLNNNDCYV